VARIKMLELVEALAQPLRGALDEAVARTLPETEVDKAQLYREFRRSLLARTKQWERVPNSVVDED
jgi:hypothetical protein